jgi:hypothetical protein
MKNFGIKYLAYLALPKFPMFKSGQIPLDNTTPLGTGTGTRIYTDEIPIVGWPTYYNPPKVMLSILGIEINSGTQCSLKSVASAITGTSFTMEVTATDDSTYLSLLIGWVSNPINYRLPTQTSSSSRVCSSPQQPSTKQPTTSLTARVGTPTKASHSPEAPSNQSTPSSTNHLG